jgi:hypothetical protein
MMYIIKNNVIERNDTKENRDQCDTRWSTVRNKKHDGYY